MKISGMRKPQLEELHANLNEESYISAFKEVRLKQLCSVLWASGTRFLLMNCRM